MIFGNELVKIRRYLRDPEGAIWNTSLLMEFYNQAQNDLNNNSYPIEDVTTIPVPPRYNYSYLHDFESAFLTGNTYRALRQQQDYFAYVARFEVQENFGISADVTDGGTIGYIHPFEAWIDEPNKVVAFPFPDNYCSTKAFLYNNRSIDYRTKKYIQQTDGGLETRVGTTQWYYRDDQFSNQFIPYPRPSSTDWNDESGTGMITSIEDDTVPSEVGTIIQMTGSLLSSDDGVAVSAIDSDDNFTLIYDVTPVEVTSLGTELDWPDFLLKYVRFRTLELAFKSNNDGKIQSLGEYWGNRYRLGLEAVTKYLSNRRIDRDYRLKGSSRTSKRPYPKLPDTYPAT